MIDNLVVYKPINLEKIRLGKDNDGGYIIIDSLDYDCIITAGINNDISFERDMAGKYPTLPFFMFDCSIDQLPDGFDHGFFYKEKIGVNNILRPYFEMYDSIFIKMDVEGWETHWLPAVPKEHILKIKQLVIEFHGITFSYKCFDILADTHYLIHLHANNFGGTDKVGDRDVPRILECTYIRKDLCEVMLNDEIIPGPLDMPNNPNKIDYTLDYKPFYHG